jgi:hypothetical protein
MGNTCLKLEEKLLAHHHGSQDGTPQTGGIRSRASSFAPGSYKLDSVGDADRHIPTLEDQAKKEGVARSQAWLHAHSITPHLTSEEESEVISESRANHGEHLLSHRSPYYLTAVAFATLFHQ